MRPGLLPQRAAHCIWGGAPRSAVAQLSRRVVAALAAAMGPTLLASTPRQPYQASLPPLVRAGCGRSGSGWLLRLPGSRASC